MTTKRYYKVAGHVMALTADDGIFAMLDNCRPFEVEAGDALLEMDIHRDMPEPTCSLISLSERQISLSTILLV